MTRLLIPVVAFIAISCSTTKHTTNPYRELNGNWIPVREEFAGKEMPKSFYDKSKLTIADTNYTFVAESVDKGSVKINGDKMDLYGRQGVNTGKHFMALFKFENGQLTICYNLKGDGYPETFNTKGKASFFMAVFTRQ